MSTDKKPKVSIGLPVYNGEPFIHDRLESILSQTFTDFELIISDNASTDSTQKICKEFEKKEKRIRYIRQEKNMGAFWNFEFVLKESKGDYFVWASVDDIWVKEFLEKNVRILNENLNVVGCTGKVERVGNKINEFNDFPDDSKIIKTYKRFRRHFRPFGTFSAYGKIEKKARLYLRKQSSQAIYAVYRRNILLDSFVSKQISAFDMAIILGVLKHGDFHVIDQVLWYYYSGGVSSKGLLERYKNGEFSVYDLFLGPSDFVGWCINNLGKKFFFKNLDIFLWYYSINPIGMLMELCTKIVNFTKKLGN